nr:unnamed protein product [Spirometra erinaceieuropaei]
MMTGRKAARGPLKVVYEPPLPHPTPNDPEKSKSLLPIGTAADEHATGDESHFKENLGRIHTYWTDSDDALSVSSSTTNPSSQESIDFSPLLRRSSTRRISRLLLSQRSDADIRRHFPVACRSAMQLKTASPTPHQPWATGVVTEGERKRVATTAADAVSGRLSMLCNDSLSCACCTTPKRPRTAEIQLTQPRGASPSSHAFPSLLIMGAGVRSHPLYACKRRLSMETEAEVDGCFPPNDEVATSSLAPICPVPMPPAFQASILNEEPTRAWNITKRTAQTQTSPSPPPRSSHRSRRSSGAKVLSSIKKKMGSIRRAVSADRNDKRFFSSFTSTTKPSRNRRSSESNLCTPKIPTNYDRVGATAGQSAVTCVLLQTFSDRSYLVQLKRTSTAIQFGFYIAKDSQG